MKPTTGSEYRHAAVFTPYLAPKLFVRDDQGRCLVATADQILHAARHAVDQKVQRGASFESAQAVHDYLRAKLAGFEYEVFAALFLDGHNRLIEYVEMLRGTIDQTSVYPREVVKEALRLNTAAVIFSHNHPDGNPKPSRADEALTYTLRGALATVDVRVLDHVIVAGTLTCSLAEHGLL